MAHNDSFDEPRFEALYRKLYPDLLRCAEIALRTGGSWYVSVAGRAEEVVQELFAFAWEHQADLWSSASPTGWLYRVLRYKVLELLKEDRFWRKHLIRAAGEMPASPEDDFQQRDANPPAAEADVDAAWRDFKENYQGQASAYETEVLPERDSSHLDQITSPSPKKKSRRILRAAVITAACIVILCGAASAFGFDLLQAFADWTAETFGFVTPGQEEAEAPQDDPYQRLRFAVSLETDLPLIPNWAPEGTVSDGEISVIERSNGIRLQGTYKTDNASFSIRVVLYNVLPEEYASIYQKSDETMIEYSAGNIMHYLMNNNEIYSVTWVNENAEVLIQGNLSIADLEKMVDSIY